MACRLCGFAKTELGALNQAETDFLAAKAKKRESMRKQVGTRYRLGTQAIPRFVLTQTVKVDTLIVVSRFVCKVIELELKFQVR